MFRSIQGSVTKRKETLRQSTDQQKILNRTVREFLISVFGPAGSRVDIEVSLEHKNLFIKTQSKTVANEIIFQSKALYEFLKKNEVIYEKVIIR